MNHKFALPGLLAVVFFSFHLRYLPASLEDLDSINFALGVRHFDVAEHQPHPPGYPVYIAAAKAINAAIVTADPSLDATVKKLEEAAEKARTERASRANAPK